MQLSELSFSMKFSYFLEIENYNVFPGNLVLAAIHEPESPPSGKSAFLCSNKAKIFIIGPK